MDPGALRWPLPTASGLRDALLAAYREPHRDYHDARHLAEVLTRLDELAAAGVAFEELPVLLAAWFHDAVYDGRTGAEDRSARWAESALAGEGLKTSTVSEVARLVRLTQSHHPGPGDANGQALSDADLGVLAAPEARYDEYADAVRREYAEIPEAAFRAGRAEVLRELLARERLFASAYARQAWEDSARRNVTRELAGLEAQ